MVSDREKRRALLLGLGLDAKDEHVRITRGGNFRLLGGSQETHEEMQEKAIKFNEALSRRKKELHEIDAGEFREIAHEVGMHVPRKGGGEGD